MFEDDVGGVTGMESGEVKVLVKGEVVGDEGVAHGVPGDIKDRFNVVELDMFEAVEG